MIFFKILFKICLDNLLCFGFFFNQSLEPSVSWGIVIFMDTHQGDTLHQFVSLPTTGPLNKSETGSSNKLFQLSPGSQPNGLGQAEPPAPSLGSIMSEFLTHTLTHAHLHTPVCQRSPPGLPQQSADITIKGRTHWSSITCAHTRRVRTVCFPRHAKREACV